MLKSMESMTGRLSNLWPWRNRFDEIDAQNIPSTSREERLNRAIGPYETMVFKLQSLLIWENPFTSTIFVIGMNLLFWLLITIGCRFYSLTCLTVLVIFIYNLWVEEIWPEIRVPPQDTPDSEDWTPIHPSVLSVPEISHYLNHARSMITDFIDKAKLMRYEQPGLFCGTSSAVLVLVWVIGRAVPGMWLLYLLMNTLLLLPGVCIHLIPPQTMAKVAEVKEKVSEVKQFFFPPLTGEGREEAVEADLIPEESAETMALLSLTQVDDNVNDEEELASLLPGDIPVPDDNGDSSTTHNSLTPGLGFMPSHEEESIDGLDYLADFETSDSNLPPAASSQQDNDGIRFRARHFNGDDSSDEDDLSLSHGLKFSDTTTTQEVSLSETASGPFSDMLTRAAAAVAIENMAKTFVDAVSSVAQSVASKAAAAQPTLQPSVSTEESDEDFEIINQDDLPNVS